MKYTLTTAISLALGSSAALGQYRLVELQPIDGGDESIATAIDDQGRIVGSSRNASRERLAVLWPAADQPPIVLGVLDGGTQSEGVAIRDGLVIGVGDRPCGERGVFAWSADEGLREFGPDTCSATEAFSVNNSGDALLELGAPGLPVIWPIEGGSPRFLNTWGQPASVFRIDDQGRVVGASAFHPDGGGNTRAIQWNADGSTVLLPRLDPTASGPELATDRNDDGLIVGQSRVDGRTRAVVWGLSAEPLDAGGPLGPGVTSSLLAINDDGQAVGGSSIGAIVWDADAGVQPLETLVDSSADGWSLSAAQDINGEGAIAGNGMSPAGDIRGFVLLPGGTACRADLDGDGSLTLFDFLAFQNLFDGGDPRADFDGDGSLTIFDFLAFQNAFDSGC